MSAAADDASVPRADSADRRRFRLVTVFHRRRRRGGHGSLHAAILAANPRMHGHLVDLEPTAAGASRTFSAHDLDERTSVTAGSFFDPLPAGADAYLLLPA